MQVTGDGLETYSLFSLGTFAFNASGFVKAGLASRAPVMWRLRAVTLAEGILTEVVEKD